MYFTTNIQKFKGKLEILEFSFELLALPALMTPPEQVYLRCQISNERFGMQVVSQDFFLSYTLKGGLVRSVAEGSFDGRSYSASVRIEASNVYDVPNEKTGAIDTIKRELIFKIPCTDNVTAGQVLSYIREKFKKRESLNIDGGIPDNNGVVKVNTPVEYFLGVEMKKAK